MAMHSDFVGTPQNGRAPPPVSRLPTEILSRVFFHLADDFPAVEISSGNQTHKHIQIVGLGWSRVAHVCRYWKAVALEACSGLWEDDAKIEDPSGGNLPRFQIDNTTRTPPLANTTEATTQEAEEMLRLSAQTIIFEERFLEPLNPLLDRLLRGSIPQLATLKISSTVSSAPKVWPDNLLADSAPCLRNLSLVRVVNIPWSSSLFTKLEYLTVDLRYPTTETQSLQVILNALTITAQSLRHLDLALRKHDGERITEVVRLPNLIKLKLSGCLGPLRNFHIPTTAQATAVLENDLVPDWELHAALTALVRFFHGDKLSSVESTSEPTLSVTSRPASGWAVSGHWSDKSGAAISLHFHRIGIEYADMCTLVNAACAPLSCDIITREI